MIKQVAKGQFYRMIGHGPCVLITSSDGMRSNIAPVAWTTPINDAPPLLGVALAAAHYTTKLIAKSGEFTVNIPDSSLIPAVKAAGNVSGCKIDKFAKTGLTPIRGTKIKTPHIRECIGFIECKVIDKMQYDGVVFYVGKVVYCAADNSRFNKMWNKNADTIHHLGGQVFAVMGKILK